MARQPVSIPDSLPLLWQPIVTGEDDNVPGPLVKTLTTDLATGALTKLVHLPPGWSDPVLEWHPVYEEGFQLAPEFRADGEPYVPGHYLYRPPGYLHGPPEAPSVRPRTAYTGMTFLVRMGGRFRVHRYYGTKYPKRDDQPVTDDHTDWPIDLTKCHVGSRAWENAQAGPWAGAQYQWLHRNRLTGGGAIIFRFPPGWSGTGAAGRGTVEEFVADGSIVINGETYEKWGYVCRPASRPGSIYHTSGGAHLICWWDDESELQ